jgi:DNA-binding CsgD family transcriptional regulator
LTPLHQISSEQMIRARLHLVDSKGVPLGPTLQTACETAFLWVIRDNPQFDQAQIANWSEEIGAVMQARGELLKSPRRYAYAALRGKVRDWRRTGAGRAELMGMRPELEYIGGVTESSAAEVETKILFEQLSFSLKERDRAILVLLTRGESTAQIAAFLGMNYAAAAKAMQRVKDRISIVVDGNRHKKQPELEGNLAVRKGKVSESRADEGLPPGILSEPGEEGLSRRGLVAGPGRGPYQP